MIHVDRKAVPVPRALDGSDSKASKELAKARLHYADPDPGSFSFKAYKDDTVKAALETLFHGKCAYCEIKYEGNQPVDVEHYRPKSGYVGTDEKLVKPGYWWLAADWENLLPSCIDCNRRRGHETIDDIEETLGKANLFPIDDEATRAKTEGEEAGEVRLLLDPCRDRPEKLLFFREKGAVRAWHDEKRGDDTVKLTDLEQRIVEASLRVYGLNRSGLGGLRREKAIEIQGTLDAIAKTATAITKRVGAGEDPSEDNRAELANLARRLLGYRRADAPFAGLARQHCGEVPAALDGFVKRHFATELAQPSPDAGSPDAGSPDAGSPDAASLPFLTKFIDRFATRQTVRESRNDALVALGA